MCNNIRVVYIPNNYNINFSGTAQNFQTTDAIETTSETTTFHASETTQGTHTIAVTHSTEGTLTSHAGPTTQDITATQEGHTTGESATTDAGRYYLFYCWIGDHILFPFLLFISFNFVTIFILFQELPCLQWSSTFVMTSSSCTT